MKIFDGSGISSVTNLKVMRSCASTGVALKRLLLPSMPKFPNVRLPLPNVRPVLAGVYSRDSDPLSFDTT